MSNPLLFNSFTHPIPPIRNDIQLLPIEHEGESLLLFYDVLGYSTPNFTLPSDSETILSLLDGTRSIDDIIKFSIGEVSKNDLLDYVKYLDENGILQSEYFKYRAEQIEQDYEQSHYHQANSAGISYPDKPDLLISYLHKAFNTHPNSKPKEVRAMLAPHIDPRVGMESFVKAFSAIRHLTPKKVFIIATSHYSGLYGNMYDEFPFIVSEKTFLLPNGSLPANQDFRKMNSPKKWKTMGVSFHDRAHRVEHSVELHALFLNHIWKHEFEIIPILVGSMDELMYSDHSFRHEQLTAFAQFLNKKYGNDPDAFFLISGDLSHFGHKFGDEEPASELFAQAEENDQLFLKAAASGNPKFLLQHIRENYDRFRICGFPPLLTFLTAFEGWKGELLTYDLWDERERNSAVSFGSMLFN